MAKLIPRNISYSHNSGRLLVDLSCEKIIDKSSLSYEVTCPSEPDNEPDQPQEELPQEDPWPDIAPRGVPFVRTGPVYYDSNEFGYEPDIARDVSGVLGTATQILSDYSFWQMPLIDDLNTALIANTSFNQISYFKYPSGPMKYLATWWSNFGHSILMEAGIAAILDNDPENEGWKRLNKVDVFAETYTPLHIEQKTYPYHYNDPEFIWWEYVNNQRCLFWIDIQGVWGVSHHILVHKYNWETHTYSLVVDYDTGYPETYTDIEFHANAFAINKKIYLLPYELTALVTYIEYYVFDTQTNDFQVYRYSLHTGDPEEVDFAYIFDSAPYLSLNRIYLHYYWWGGEDEVFRKCYLDLSTNLLKGHENFDPDTFWDFYTAYDGEKGYYISCNAGTDGNVYDFATDELVANAGAHTTDRYCRQLDDNENRLWRLTDSDTLTGYLLDGSMTSRSITLSESMPVPSLSYAERYVFIRNGFFYIVVSGMSVGVAGRLWKVI